MAPCAETRYTGVNTELRVFADSSDLTTTTSRAQLALSDDSGASTIHPLRWRSCSQP